MDPKLIGGYFLVGGIWGTTNAFMEVATEQQKEKKSSGALSDTGDMFSNWRFLVPFLLNQVGGILNNFVVAASDLSIAVPFVNCITFIITFITQKILKGESLVDLKFFSGSMLIMVGMYFCINK